MSSKKITIGMPVYNSEKYIERALRSLENQTFKDFEVIISDNGSTDNSVEIIQDFVSRNSNFTLFQQDKNIGMLENYNFVFQKCKTELFGWLSHDDFYEENFLKEISSHFKKNENLGMVYGKVKFYDEYGKAVGMNYSFKNLESLVPQKNYPYFLNALLFLIERRPHAPLYGIFKKNTFYRNPFREFLKGGSNADTMLLLEYFLRNKVDFAPNAIFKNSYLVKPAEVYSDNKEYKNYSDVKKEIVIFWNLNKFIFNSGKIINIFIYPLLPIAYLLLGLKNIMKKVLNKKL